MKSILLAFGRGWTLEDQAIVERFSESMAESMVFDLIKSKPEGETIMALITEYKHKNEFLLADIFRVGWELSSGDMK